MLASRLLHLAEKQVTQSGLSTLRARSLAEAAGCSVGAIYGVYPDLDELILRVNERTLDALDAALGQITPDGPATCRLVELAETYLGYAHENRTRWDALFQHRMAAGRTPPGWYVDRRRAAFLPLAGPLAELRPDLSDAGRAALARTVFSAVHGIVALGLDELLHPTPLPELRVQLSAMVVAMASGLAAGGSA